MQQTGNNALGEILIADQLALRQDYPELFVCS